MPSARAHSPFDDLQALATGCLLAAFGIVVLEAGGVLVGGTVGLSLLAAYAGGVDAGLALVLVNAPFHAFAALRMGREFTVKTLASVGLVAAFVHLLPRGVALAWISPWLAAVLGGLLAGVGLLVLFRHAASLGGLNVVALHAQRRWGWSAGKVQLALDAAILAAGCAALGDLDRLPASALAVLVLNGVLAVNHRPGRYLATG